MKKFFFYRKDLIRVNKTVNGEFNILVKKLIKIKFKQQIFLINFSNRLIKKNFCLKTGRKHSVNSLYYLSRISLKEVFRDRLISGLRRISW
uniref:Ribosomal protein S14 n=1 Tax=Paramoeba aparasomata TaxID=2583407 RepID=A0A5P8HBK0_9EUKA|nr:ribosomal protein S14 [Paramoeba aparasomata]